MTNFLLKYAPQGKEYERLAQQERLILDVSEKVWAQTGYQKKTLQYLADALGKTKGHISRLLGGEANMTLRSLADLAYSLDCDIKMDLSPKVTYRHAREIYTSPFANLDRMRQGKPISFNKKPVGYHDAAEYEKAA